MNRFVTDSPLDPLLFTASPRPRIWGGRRLADLLGKSLADDQPYGESWELSPIEPYISRVEDGPFAGVRLDDLWNSHRQQLAGSREDLLALDTFPLLIKWLDCTDRVSVQVHPDDATARELGFPCGKAEAWLVIDAAPSATVGIGIKKGITRHGFERRLAAGTVEEALHVFHPSAGDALSVPPGTVHTLGGGLLLLEISQPSDATLRLFDWNRLGPDGRPRPLHHQDALRSIDWNRGPVSAKPPRPLPPPAPHVTAAVLIDEPQFVMQRLTAREAFDSPAPQEMTVFVVVDGEAELRHEGRWSRRLGCGRTVLVPAGTQTSWHPVPGGELTLAAVTLPAGILSHRLL